MAGTDILNCVGFPATVCLKLYHSLRSVSQNKTLSSTEIQLFLHLSFMPHSLTPRDAHLFRTTAAALPARPQMFRLLKVMSIYWLSHHIVIPALTRVPLRSLHICYNTPTLLRLLSPVPVTSFPTTARPLPAPFKSRLRPPPASDSRLHFHDPCMCQSVVKYSY